VDLIKIKKRLKDDYNCTLIIQFDYVGIKFVKAFETTEEGVIYRYFNILNDDMIKEITDELLLDYLKKMNETNDENNY
jgi:hypothetical protein